MVNRKTPTKARPARSGLDVTELEKRVEALERRVAILEAKQPQPTLAETLTDPAPTGRRVGLAQEQ